jgi:hypothetical protein
LSRDFDFEQGISVALMDSTFCRSDSDTLWQDISQHEIRGRGYLAGGKALRNISISRNESGIRVDGDDIVWIDASLTAHAMVMFSAYTHGLIASFVFDRRMTCDRKFTIEWNHKGIIHEPNPDEPPQYLTSYLERGIH